MPKNLRETAAFRVLVAVLAGLALLLVVWSVIPSVLATDRGLDLTDEGLYLLAADPDAAITPLSSLGSWHTAPLFRLTAYDIANFRRLGVLLLVVAGGFLGFVAMRYSNAVSCSVNDTRFWVYPLGILTGVFGAFLYYASLVTTPSYNWLNLFGLILASAGYIGLSQKVSTYSQCIPQYNFCLSLVAALGIFVTIPAKPSSAPFVILLGGLFVLSRRSIPDALRVSFKIVVLTIACLAIAITSGLWPTSFVQQFREAFSGPALMPDQSIQGALYNLWRVPFVFIEQISELSSVVIASLAIALLLLTFAVIPCRRWSKLSIAFFLIGLLLACVSCLTIARATFGVLHDGEAVERLAFAPTVTACLCLVLVSLVPVLLQALIKCLGGNACLIAVSYTQNLLLAAFLCALPFVFGFGSGNSPFRMSSLAAVFFLLSALVINLSWSALKLRLGACLILTIFAGILCSATIADSRAMPYRQVDIALQTQPLSVGTHGSVLHVAPGVEQHLSQLRRQAQENGWTMGTPLLGVVWRWAATVPYVLGANVPDCLVLTIFGYPTSVRVAQHRIETRLASFPSEQAWILTSDPTYLNASETLELKKVLAELSTASGRRFPADYKKVAHQYDLELWKPLD
jgi:hypothetical protein